MKKYWILIGAEYQKPLKAESSGKMVKGFYQNFGATFYTKDQTISEIKKIILDENASIFKIEVKEDIVFDNLDAVIKKESSDPDKVGVWYASGHVYF